MTDDEIAAERQAWNAFRERYETYMDAVLSGVPGFAPTPRTWVHGEPRNRHEARAIEYQVKEYLVRSGQVRPPGRYN